jgi:3-oxochol-4-en-24-oyl-CoA dehydrogenase
VDFELPGADDPRRQAVCAWLDAHPAPTGRQLAEAGYVAPHWPRPWGHDADPVHQLVIDDELRRAKIRRPTNPIGIGWAGPTILQAGTDAQRDRYLMPLLAGDEMWCQLFSEPDAGSDLAAINTRAVRDGDTYVVTGQKIWTSLAQYASFGILIARTDASYLSPSQAPASAATDSKAAVPAATKHRGISYFICPMDTPGIEVRPIKEMTGVALFNEVFFDDVRIPAENRVGPEHEGWSLAKVTLANERVSLSSEGALWGRGPSAHDLVDLVRDRGGVADPVMRQRVAALYAEAEVLRLIRLRTLTARVKGEAPGPEASVGKVLADEHGQRIMGLAKDLAGTGGMVAGSGPLGDENAEWHYGYLFAPALTIGGGTAEVQRNIIGERALGLPHDP